MDTLFKVGDNVMLSPRLCNTQDLEDFGSLGTIGNTYTIIDIDYIEHGKIVYELEGNNWHREEWLIPYFSKNIIGGELL